MLYYKCVYDVNIVLYITLFERRRHKVLEGMYNKINYICQHYNLLIHKATCSDPSIGHLQAYIAE